MNLLPRPGDLTVPFKGGPIGLYRDFPQNDVIAAIAHDSLEASDGFVFVLAHVEKWLFVLTTSQKLGWVYEYDVGPNDVAGAVYHI